MDPPNHDFIEKYLNQAYESGVMEVEEYKSKSS